MAPIQDLLPAILASKDYSRWPGRSDGSPPPIVLLRQFDAKAMETHEANKLVGNVRNNGPAMLHSG
jgi:putative SOS response-associated peptidase YedK